MRNLIAGLGPAGVAMMSKETKNWRGIRTVVANLRDLSAVEGALEVEEDLRRGCSVADEVEWGSRVDAQPLTFEDVFAVGAVVGQVGGYVVRVLIVCSDVE